MWTLEFISLPCNMATVNCWIIAGTFDVRNVNATRTIIDGVNVSSTFINGTRARGVLYVFWINGQNLYRQYQPYFYPVKKEKAEAGFYFVNPSYLYNTISAYDIEYNNKIYSGLPAAEIEIITNIIEIEGTSGYIGNNVFLKILKYKAGLVINYYKFLFE